MVISTALTSCAYISSSYVSLKILPLRFRELIMSSVWRLGLQCRARAGDSLDSSFDSVSLSVRRSLRLSEKKHATASGGSVHHGVMTV